ncbi:MAG: class I SAM-dependent methyltransferase [Pirellulaceae bacterium]|nr:class I SAM-dependent methyltransferase [Pirellulaceae bacterium]
MLQTAIHKTIDLFFSFSWLRKAYWKFWYPLLTRKTAKEPLFFLNYAYVESPPLELALEAEDEKDRPCIGLYHHVASQADLQGKDVLEVSCGHGGGASYVKRYLKPQKLTGLDLNAVGVELCRQHHQLDGLEFVQGDAENLPFVDASLDVVMNVEASHCYPHFPRFLSEVHRILKPGGYFLYADFRFEKNRAAWEEAIAASPLTVVRTENISPQVLRGLDSLSDRSQKMVSKLLPRFLHWLGKDFAGTKGSRVYNALQSGNMVYRSYCFRK